MMTTLEDRIQTPRFYNWLKSALTLDFARDAVKEFVETKIKTYHDSLVHNISAVSSSCGFGPSSKCQDKTCAHIELEKRIKIRHVRTPSFGNTNPKDCWSQPWEFAKCFLSPIGNQNINTADDTDLPGLISVIINSRDFNAYLQAISRGTDIFNQARDVRNEIMHNPAFEVDEKKFQHYTDVCKEMLDCIPTSDTRKSSLLRIDELLRGSLTISAEDITRVIKDTIGSLRLLKDEIQHSISDMTDLTKKMEVKATECVNSLELKVIEGVITIERKTKDGVQKLNEETEMGLAGIKKEKEEAAGEITSKTNEGVDAIASTANKVSSQLQLQRYESTSSLRETGKTEAETIRYETQKATEDIKKQAELEGIEIRENKKQLEALMNDKLKKLHSNLENDNQTNSENENVRDELRHNTERIQQSTYSCVKTLQDVTNDCMESLRQQTEECTTCIRDASTQSEQNKRNDFEIIRSEFRGELHKVLQEIRELISEKEDTRARTKSISQETEKLATFIGDSNSSAEDDKHIDIEDRHLEPGGTKEDEERVISDGKSRPEPDFNTHGYRSKCTNPENEKIAHVLYIEKELTG